MERRRRFVPSGDHLEGRKLLTAAATPAPSYSVTPTTDVITNLTPTKYGHDTPQDLFVSNISSQRQFRIAQLPVYLELVDTRRTVPEPIVKALQTDLEAIRNRLVAPPSDLLTGFTETLRATLTNQTISPDHARVLNAQFGQILEASGSPPDLTAQFQSDMNALVRTNVQGPNPGVVTANDYALIVQYVLAIGRRTGPAAAAK